MNKWMGMVASLMLASCGAAITETRMLVRPAKPADCPLEIVEVSPADMYPNGRFGANGDYDMVGMISIGTAEGTNALSEEIRKLVRPRACDMGGETLSLLASGTGADAAGHAQQNISFTVWAKKIAAPATPQKF